MPGQQTVSSGSPLYDLFISYAHEDREFVIRLRGWLEAAGFRVWLDEERMRAGDPVQDRIYQALLHSEKAVFVLSEASLSSPWTRYELRTFGEEAAARRKIAILRTALTSGRIPVHLGEDLHIRWHDEGEPEFSRFWLLYCGLRGLDPGKREEWERKGREVCRADESKGGYGPPLLFPGTPAEEEWHSARAARQGSGRAVWECDRKDQREEIVAHATKPKHEALFVIGPRGEGHNYFLDSVEECYPDEPERWVRKVHWGARIPRDRDELFRALAQALRSSSPECAALKDMLRTWLRDRNLILVHRPVRVARLGDEALARYYTRWLPELLPELGAGLGVLKVVQGIDWSPSLGSRLLAGRAGTARPAPAETQSPAGETRKALKEICDAASELLPIVLLPALKPITRKHVKTWAESLPKDLVGEPGEFVQDVLEGAHHSSDILARIVERLSAAEER